jgi:hypothetical protein
MSTPSAVPRTAPIAIAPKPSRLAPSRQGSINVDYPYLGGRSGFDSPGSESPLSGLPPVPCEACQRRGIKCVMGDEDDCCISCQVNGNECSLVESPQPRKRKLELNGDGGDYSHSKRRLVSLSLGLGLSPTCCATPTARPFLERSF